jgi:hypothetical protein
MLHTIRCFGRVWKESVSSLGARRAQHHFVDASDIDSGNGRLMQFECKEEKDYHTS